MNGKSIQIKLIHILKKQTTTDMDDNSIMTFRVHKGKALANVPATYLIFIFENNYKMPDELRAYIKENLDVLRFDLFLVRPSGYCVEIEIKISIADLKKDATKKHGHEHKLIRELYFAIPEKMLKHIEHIPARAGIFIVKSTEYETPSGEKYINHHAYLYRKAKINVDARTIKDSEVSTLCRLTSIRLWNEKRKHHVNK